MKRWIGVVLCCLSATAAGECRDDAQAVVADLVASGVLAPAIRERAEGIAEATLCDRAAIAAEVRAEAEKTKVLGIELEAAGKDSKGHQRLKRKR